MVEKRGLELEEIDVKITKAELEELGVYDVVADYILMKNGRKDLQVYIPTVKSHLHGQTVPPSRLN